MGFIGQKLRNILWDILVKSYRILSGKTMEYPGPLDILSKN